MQKLATILVMVLALAACQPEPPQPPAGGLTGAERAECLDHGGTIGRGGLMPGDICFRPTPDAGKSCRKASDCSGVCLSDSRTCSKTTPQLGCFEYLDAEGRTVGLCVD